MIIRVHKVALFTLCIAFLAAAGGATGLGMALGALGLTIGALWLAHTIWQILAR